MQAFVRIIPNSQTATRTCKRHDLRGMQAILLPSTGAQLPQRGDTRELKRTHQSALESLLAKAMHDAPFTPYASHLNITAAITRTPAMVMI
jgi:hypothetical protein